MKKAAFLFLLLFSYAFGYAQNLVPNPGFEKYNGCPPGRANTVHVLTLACADWYQYTVGGVGMQGGTADYLHACYPNPNSPIGVGIPKNGYGYQAALDGDAYLGIYTSGSSNGRGNFKEYAAARITPLTPGYTYQVSISVSLADSSVFGTDDLGVHFFQNGPDTIETDEVLPVTPKISFSSYGAITDKTGWTRLTGVMVADSAYNHIIIGGFKDSTTQIKVPTPPGQFSSYYYVDGVEVKIFEGAHLKLNDTLICPGNNIAISYTVDSGSFFLPGNMFTVELSDSAGSFKYPVLIGSLAGTTSGTISCNIPANILQGGSYRVRLLSSAPVATFYSDAKIGIYRLAPIVTGPGSLCEGQPLKLSVTEKIPGVTISWNGPEGYSSNSSDTTIANTTLRFSGTYHANVALDNCFGSDSADVLIKPLPAKPDLTSNSPVFVGDQLEIGVLNPGNSYSYAWSGPAGFASATANTTIPSATKDHRGIYILTVIGEGCENKNSIAVDVIDQSQLDEFYVYPNPNNGNFTIGGYILGNQLIRLKVVNAVGQLIYKENVDVKGRKLAHNVSLPFVASGNYMLYIRADGKDIGVKFTILH